MCWILFICKWPASFIESINQSGSPKKNIWTSWNSETNQNLNIYLYNYQTEAAIFLATKHQKTIMACSYLNFLKIFSSFQTFDPQYYKNESIHPNSWKHRSYLLIFSLELEIFGVAIQKMHQNSKNGGFCEKWLSENDFEAVLVNFCCYDYLWCQCFRGSLED